MVEKKHQLFGTDLRMVDLAGKNSGISFQAENMDTPAGFSADTDSTLSSFADTMKLIEKANTDYESLTPDELRILAVVGFRPR